MSKARVSDFVVPTDSVVSAGATSHVKDAASTSTAFGRDGSTTKFSVTSSASKTSWRRETAFCASARKPRDIANERDIER